MARSSWILGLRPAASFSRVWAAAFAWLLASHWPLLDLPYHWDELGYFVPAAHDLLTSGTLIPRSTPPNVHPPLVMAWLALAWKLFGFAPVVTRTAMLAAGAAAIAGVWALARNTAGEGAAWTAAALTAASPPFFAQSLLAHLDLPSAWWALLALHWFFRERWGLCAAAGAALALTKETGIVVPLVLAMSNRRRAWIAIPAAAVLAAWILYVRSNTGYWLGNPEFERYNLDQAAQWGRVPLVLLRRLYQLGFANFHWIALGAAWRARGWTSEERVMGRVIAAYVVLHSVAGGAVLVRYLLPAMALFYVVVAPRLGRAAAGALLAGLAVSNWWNPPYPFGYEDNLAVVDFVRLQQEAAAWVQAHHPDRTVTTAWPLTDALANPLGGYVRQAVRVRPVEDFRPASWAGVKSGELDLVALYSRTWEPEPGWQQWGPMARLLERYFGYTPQIGREELMRRFGLASLARWERRGQWIEVFERRALSGPVRAGSRYH